MTADEARRIAASVRALLREAIRALSVPRPDWWRAAKAFAWAATLCMELVRDCRREAGHGGRDWIEDGDR